MKPKKSLAKWLDYIESLHPSEIELGLDRVQQVADRAGVLSQTPFVVTIAGTNGKGTTIAALESVLLEAGLCVGAYTSPHLLHYNERVRINGRMISDQSLCESFSEIDDIRQDISLTYFEFATLSALWLFKRESLDIILLEVGLGGRLDAVNAVEPDVSVLTSIGFDHTDWLGTTLESIAAEKAAIVRDGKPFICGADNLPTRVQEALTKRALPFIPRSQFDASTIEDGQGGDKWSWQGIDERNDPVEINGLPPTKIPLANASVALQVLQFLPFEIDDHQVIVGIEKAKLAGRLQQFNIGKMTFLVDVAHNEQAATYLAEQLVKIRLKYNKVIALYSALRDKDSDAVIKVMSGVVDSWLIASLDAPRASTIEQLNSSLQTNHIDNAQCFTTVREALLHLSLINDQKTLIVVFGSFYTVAEALQFYTQSEQQES